MSTTTKPGRPARSSKRRQGRSGHQFRVHHQHAVALPRGRRRLGHLRNLGDEVAERRDLHARETGHPQLDQSLTLLHHARRHHVVA
ncbi:MAG TPA: hypothetical protein VNT31_04365 [Nocardioides sp.]|nr:hypothetical protein [Nocardioides sp.]